ncbi:DNA repair protein RecN [Thioflavicoccus mobilis 8321]|uniref:DNA repair protein RecN n=1 Tax=Thioflavicoccus mobilis 8321 TaxID=765912 RepID=L0H106_9GAMM|nr:DNA repair protein RecN [Thioflavicoccus mobilis]AGA91264.1 DNA repair protein RecN [Thioflavicoccus mobilis 8321]
MLTHILIKDLAIVSTIEVDLDGGMTALTGETGAGKSIMIDALGLALGDKADAGLVRAGSERAEIVATFDLTACPAARAWLADQALDDEDSCIVRRLLVREGRSRAFINGRPATGAQLGELGERLVDIHGQHAHQSLLRPAAQRALLDEYGGHRELAERVAAAHRRYRDLDEQLRGLEAAGAQRTERLELLRYQVDELAALALGADELDELDREQRRLGNLGRLQETSAALLLRLSEGEPALQDELRHAGVELAELCTIDARLEESRELLESAAIQVDEAAANLRQYLDGLDVDPATIEAVETRLGEIHDLARKYRVFPQQLLDTLETWRRDLVELEEGEVRLEAIAAERDQAHEAFLALAAELSEARADAAKRLGATVTEAMQQLGMAGGRFAVELTRLDAEAGGAFGLDRIEFRVSANPGQPLQPLAKVASGGELSRISLAIQVATAECGGVPILVFDEVDVGIGGGVAEIVGRLLRRLGEARQVLCVTHLPQVAAQAHRQIKVRKHNRRDQTFTEILALDANARVEEIARMLGGAAITAKTRAHAQEMLETAGS